jgi:hypothetical protein
VFEYLTSLQILGNAPFIVMGNRKVCPSGTDFSKKECRTAYNWANKMDTSIKSVGAALEDFAIGSSKDVPYHCSIKTGTITTFQYNSQKVSTANLTRFKSGEYNMICKIKTGNFF